MCGIKMMRGIPHGWFCDTAGADCSLQKNYFFAVSPKEITENERKWKNLIDAFRCSILQERAVEVPTCHSKQTKVRLYNYIIVHPIFL